MASIGTSECNGSDWRSASNVEGCSASPHVRTIRYSTAVLQEIRANALASFISIPRGGLEIGGVLFGTADAGEVWIRAYRPLAIEYLTGPSFILSDKDEVSLQSLLEQSVFDPEFAGLHAVGWYHSHTRSNVFLSEKDIAVHEKFFPNPDQIALVIKPFRFEPAQVGIFVRDAGLLLRGEDPYCRLTIDAPLPDASEMQGEDADRLSAVPPPCVEESAPELRPEPEQPSAPVSAAAAAHLGVDPNPAPAVPRRRTAMAIAAVVLITAGVIIFALTNPLAGPEPPPYQLRVTEAANQLIIGWNQKSPSLVHAQSAEIAITDGDRGTSSVPLGNETLNRGTITYVRRSGDVQVRMRVRLRNGRLMEEIARFIGPDPAPALESKREEPDTELMRMRDELKRVNTELSRIQPENERSRSTLPAKARALVLPPSRTDQFRDGHAAVNTSQSLALLNAPEIRPSSQLNTPALPIPAHIAPPPPVVPGSPPQRPAAQPRSGRAIWTGRLPKGGLLLIEGRGPSVGALSGLFPQKAARLRVYSADLGDSGIVVHTNGSRPNAVEPPSPDNGWNLTTYSFDPKRSRAVTVVEFPGPKNDWKRLLIRSDDRTLTMLIIDWEDLAVSNK